MSATSRPSCRGIAWRRGMAADVAPLLACRPPPSIAGEGDDLGMLPVLQFPRLRERPISPLADPAVQRLLALLPSARLVGGCVRDALAGRPSADIDLASPLPPETAAAALTQAGLRVIPTGLAHGTITAMADGRPFEITTLRRDLATDGRHAETAWTDDWRRTPPGGISPSTPCRSRPTARCMTISAARRTLRPAGSASWATRRPGWRKTTSASCASSVSTPATAPASPTPGRSPPSAPGCRAWHGSPPSGCGAS